MTLLSGWLKEQPVFTFPNDHPEKQHSDRHSLDQLYTFNEQKFILHEYKNYEALDQNKSYNFIGESSSLSATFLLGTWNFKLNF